MADKTSGKPRIIQVPDQTFKQRPLAIPDYSPSSPSTVPIVIDNGSYQLRAGWANEQTPRIVQDQVVSRYRDRKSGKTVLLYGQDVEVDAASRSGARSVFEGDVLCNFDLMEHVLDYTFLNLGIDTHSIDHPVLMTERVCTPLASRALMSELLFEAYGAPAVTYGIDSLFAFSRTGKKDGIALGMGHTSTSVVPVVNGRGLVGSARKLAWGGSQASEMMLKLVQMKYPGFPTKVTPNQATFMYRESCYFAEDFQTEIKTLADTKRINGVDTIMQFPFTVPVADEKTGEELARQAEKRKESGRRLQEIQTKQRMEKLIQQDTDLAAYNEIKEAKTKIKKADFQKMIENAGFEDEKSLDQAIKKIEESIKRAKKRSMGDEMEPEEEPSFPLLDIPDADLNEEEIKEKRKQRLFKAGYDSRVRLRAEKAAEKIRQAEIERKDEEDRTADLEGWSAKMRAEHEVVVLRMNERKRRRAALGDRKSAAAQGRMKSISHLAAEGPASKKRKKNGDDDDFGANDDDWGIYREIGGEDLEEEEEEDLGILSKLESSLLAHDPTFTRASTFASLSERQNELITSFLRGGSLSSSSSSTSSAPTGESSSTPVNNGGEPEPGGLSLEESFRIHLNVERARVPEVWFQPHIAGLDSAGIAEIVQHVLNEVELETRKRMQQSIIVTGSSASIPGLIPRLKTSLNPILPYGTPFDVRTSLLRTYPTVSVSQGVKKIGELKKESEDIALDAWKGMAAWSGTDEFEKSLVTRAEYEEFGGEYIKEHSWGNWRTG
ncbi:Actin-related protein-Arp5p [Phaffia rhodozyma]|uniref:Actin-related protein-Arp5p n=1 Tax=Phaffia rhodozyma TaxID=264483 RepID=A0A0F7SHS5_PHARH|nr:Actin-related protein-Arp5p [Phaffia rhodozyma]